MNLYKSLYIFLYFPINMYFVCRYKHESTVPSTLILMFWFYLHIENETKKNWFNFILLVFFFQFLSVIRLICSCILLDNLQVSAVPASSHVGPGGQVLNVKHRMYKVWRPASNLLSPPPPPPPVPTSPPLTLTRFFLSSRQLMWFEPGAGCTLTTKIRRSFHNHGEGPC